MQTVGDAIRALLPFGSNGEVWNAYPRRDDEVEERYFTDWARSRVISDWLPLPEWPIDAFAVASFIAKRTGAYTFVMPGLPYEGGPPDSPDSALNSDPFDLFGPEGEYRENHIRWGQFWRYGLVLERLKEKTSSDDLVSQTKKDQHLPEFLREDFVRGFSLQETKDVRHEIVKCWEGIVAAADLPLVDPIGPWEMLHVDMARRDFFRSLLKFLIIADEASAGVAQNVLHVDDDENIVPRPWLIKALDIRRLEFLQMKADVLDALLEGKEDKLPVLEAEIFNEWSDADLAPVLPKSRTISLGCSLRNLSRNVALAPITTEAQGQWMRQEGADASDVLNLLMIPYPYNLPFNAFQPCHSESDLPEHIQDRNWRWFKLDQSTYLPQSDDEREALIEDFVSTVLAAGEKCKGGHPSKPDGVNGVILPETALDFRLFKRLAERLCDIPSVEFLICGSSEAPLGAILQARGRMSKSTKIKHGNFVCTATYFSSKTGERECKYNFQHKHHRWKLTRRQIVDYGAASSLDITKDHWENIKISNRSLNFWNFRRNSSFVSLICEDLARNDPAQQLIRTVGPGLVFAILMDGPQLPQRWSGQFAASLSTDPGASVLTLTNHGILKSRDSGGKYPPSHAIALWADADGSPREITMAKDGKAVLLNISPVPVNAHSLDGRMRTKGALKWLLSGVKNVTQTDIADFLNR